MDYTWQEWRKTAQQIVIKNSKTFSKIIKIEIGLQM
jgi:hypothetical protein